MPAILLTGATEYIGGSLLPALEQKQTDSDFKLFALVPHATTAAELQKLVACKVLVGDTSDNETMRRFILDHDINMVVDTDTSFSAQAAHVLLGALADLQEERGVDTHLIHTCEASLFSSHAGIATTRTHRVQDNGSIDKLHRRLSSSVEQVDKALGVVPNVVDTAESLGIHSYLVVPPLLFGPGKALVGSRSPSQYEQLVRVARKEAQLYRVDPEDETWSLCHIDDLVDLYVRLLDGILSSTGTSPAYGEQGYYFVSSGSFSWNQLSASILGAVKGTPTLTAEQLPLASTEDIEHMAEILKCPVDMVPVNLSGSCNLFPKNALNLGWKPKYNEQDLYGGVNEFVDFIIADSAAPLPLL